jgi:ABC-type multidrug transport system fused ATPase/permease subunit
VRVFLGLLAVIAVVWLLGAAVQGILFEAALTSRRIWLFTWWFERFAFGVVVGFGLGALATWLALRGRNRSTAPTRPRRSGHDQAERTEEELAALKRELSASDIDG